MRPRKPAHEDILTFAYKAPLGSNGITVLLVDWDDSDE